MSAPTEPVIVDDVSGAISRLIQNQGPSFKDVHIANVRRLSGGLSRENWVFDATWSDHGRDHSASLIVRRDPAGSLLDTARDVEFGLLKALEETVVPAPAAYWIDADGSALGSPSLVMERLEGDCELFVLNSARPIGVRREIAEKFLRLLVDVQQVDWRSLGLDKLLGDPGPNAAAAELDRWEAALRLNQLEPVPELDLVLRWLHRRARPSSDTVLVHADFKPGNALMVGDDISALLDWETAHLGDPLEDLGWITNPVRSGEHQIKGVWEREQIIENYSKLTGRSVDPDELLWWNVFSCWKLAIIVLTGTRVFIEGTFERVHQSPTWLIRAMLKMMEEQV